MKKINVCIDCTVKSCPIIKNCTDEWINKISKIKDTYFYKKDQNIVYENSPVLGLYFVQDGIAKIYSTGINDKSQIVRITKTGGIIGHRGYGGDKYPIGASALTDCIVCFVDNDTMYEAFLENPKLTFDLMMYYSSELRASEAKLKNIAQMNVREKVASNLLYLNKVFSNYFSEGTFLINRKDLADLTGINTEQLSRALSEFVKDKVIELNKNEITIINYEYLQNLIAPF